MENLIDLIGETVSLIEPSGMSNPSPSAGRNRVLLVDDDPAQIRTLSLSDIEDLEAAPCSSGAQALDLCRRKAQRSNHRSPSS